MVTRRLHICMMALEQETDAECGLESHEGVKLRMGTVMCCSGTVGWMDAK